MPINKTKQFRMSQHIARASSFEEFANNSQFSARCKAKGVRRAIESFNDSPSFSEGEAMQEELTSFIAKEVVGLISQLSIFFSPTPTEALKELQELLATPALSNIILQELAYIQDKKQDATSTISNIFSSEDMTKEEQDEYLTFNKVKETGARARAAQWEANEAKKEFNKSRECFLECYPNHPVDTLDDYLEFTKEYN